MPVISSGIDEFVEERWGPPVVLHAQAEAEAGGVRCDAEAWSVQY